MEASAQSMIWWLLFMAIMFVFLIVVPTRTQKKREQELMSKVNALKKGDQIILANGIIGTVAGFKDTALEVKVAEGVKLTVLKTAVMGLVSDLQITTQQGGSK